MLRKLSSVRRPLKWVWACAAHGFKHPTPFTITRLPFKTSECGVLWVTLEGEWVLRGQRVSRGFSRLRRQRQLKHQKWCIWVACWSWLGARPRTALGKTGGNGTHAVRSAVGRAVGRTAHTTSTTRAGMPTGYSLCKGSIPLGGSPRLPRVTYKKEKQTENWDLCSRSLEYEMEEKHNCYLMNETPNRNGEWDISIIELWKDATFMIQLDGVLTRILTLFTAFPPLSVSNTTCNINP